jgi:CBS domain-containing protein
MTVTSILAAKGGDIISIEPTATLRAATALLAQHRIGAVLVLGAERRVVGILSERDIVQAIAARGAQALDEPVSRAMTRKVASCTGDESIPSIMERMTAGKFRHMPVVDRGELIGIISIGDVVKQRVDEMERESEAMRGYIQIA